MTAEINNRNTNINTLVNFIYDTVFLNYEQFLLSFSYYFSSQDILWTDSLFSCGNSESVCCSNNNFHKLQLLSKYYSDPAYSNTHLGYNNTNFHYWTSHSSNSHHSFSSMLMT